MTLPESTFTPDQSTHASPSIIPSTTVSESDQPFGNFTHSTSSSEDNNLFGKPLKTDFGAPSKPQSSEDSNLFGKPLKTDFGAPSKPQSSEDSNLFGKPLKTDFGASSKPKSSSEDSNLFGKPLKTELNLFGKSMSSFGSRSSKPSITTDSKFEGISLFGAPSKPQSSSENSNLFGKPLTTDFGAAFKSKPKSSTEDSNLFGKPMSSFGFGAQSSEPSFEVGNISDGARSVSKPFLGFRPPPGAWPDSDMFNIPSVTAIESSYDDPFIVQPPPGPWPDSNMFKVPTERSVIEDNNQARYWAMSGTPFGYTMVNNLSDDCYDPEQLQSGYYQFADGSSLRKYPDGSIERYFGGFDIKTDPHGNSFKCGPLTITPIRNEDIPKQVGFPWPK